MPFQLKTQKERFTKYYHFLLIIPILWATPKMQENWLNIVAKGQSEFYMLCHELLNWEDSFHLRTSIKNNKELLQTLSGAVERHFCTAVQFNWLVLKFSWEGSYVLFLIYSFSLLKMHKEVTLRKLSLNFQISF